jgi:disulfide bond formation protein DsbB
MCVLSRYTFIAIGVGSLAAAIHGPRALALKVYGSLIAVLASGRHRRFAPALVPAALPARPPRAAAPISSSS